MPIPDLDELNTMVGHELPGGTYELEDYKDWLTRDVVGATPAVDGVALPMFCYYAAIAGMGVSIDGLFQLVDATADSGVMFGEAEIDIRKPFRLGETYSVKGRITEIKRKEGRKAGVFDIVTFVLDVVDSSGEVAGVSTNAFVFPRRDD
ncbi:MAG: MaoC family dehydratase N-terminal domain-containing protein [Acidimicrobiales bacterium]